MFAVADYQKLALAVLALACEDARNHQPYRDGRHQMARDEHRKDAQQFLHGGEDLTHWCALAGVDEQALKRAVEERR